MNLLEQDLLTVSIKKEKKNTTVTANVGHMVWLAFASLIAMVLFVKR